MFGIDNSPKHSFELFGTECGNGWRSLINPLFDYIEEYNKNKPEDEHIIVQQVKEKFGGLRFYVSHFTPELEKMIDKAEELSWITCEECGSTEDVGCLNIGNWDYTRCRKCAQNLVNARKKPGVFSIINRWKLEPNEN